MNVKKNIKTANELIAKKLKKKGVSAFEFGDDDWAILFEDIAILDDGDFNELSKLENVIDINMVGEPEVTDRSLGMIIHSFPDLEQLTIGNSKLLTGNCNSMFDPLLKLRGLTLVRSSCPITSLLSSRIMSRLYNLNLIGSCVTNAALGKLVESSIKIRNLNISRTQVSHIGNAKLESIEDLLGLKLDHCAVTDRCFESLAKISGLTLVSLVNTSVSLKAAEQFAKRHKNCLVVVGDGIDDVFINEDSWDEEKFNKSL